MPIDKSWIWKDKRSDEFWDGLQAFLVRCKDYLNSEGKCPCPCMNCNNIEWGTLNELECHIHSKGFSRAYQTWIYHGESFEMPRAVQHIPQTSCEMRDALNDVARENTGNEYHANNDANNEQNSNEPTNQGGSSINDDLNELFTLADTPLYPDCDWLMTLDFVAKMSHLKATYHWTDTSFDKLLEYLRFAFPKENKIPKSQYAAKKLMKKVGLGYESIHACKYDCCLFYKEHKKKEKCPKCKESRWKDNTTDGKKVPNKVLRYFPLTPRLKRMYSFEDDAKSMIWHATGRCTEEGKMRHPVDGKAWKDFDERYPDFAREPRNVRLGLSADGFIPFANTSIPYSMWPVILTTYNIPPWLCMKDTSLMLTLLIPGSKSPGRDIDIYFQPLVDELKSLWSEGVYTRDAATNQVFKMHAMLLWTISDFPARSYLSGWSGQGYLACPTCNEDTPSTRVTGKTAYVGHRIFLPSDHKWRMDLNFNGEVETRDRPRDFDETDILRQLNKVPKLMPGKHPCYGGKNLKRKREPDELNWSKRSIFFELEYWSSLRLKHNLDVMHIEKNVCESLLGTLLMNEKSKDTTNARSDLEKLNIRKDLWLTKNARGKLLKPQPKFSFTPDQRNSFCKFIKGVKLPDGFGSNFRKKVINNDSNISGMKSHDHHIMMQRLMPIGVQGFLDPSISTPIIELCAFFKQLCARNLMEKDMSDAKDKLIMILCHFEQIYPPAFFDIMIHLVMHLPDEAIEGGPVFMRWMYPFERYMKKLKNYVRNKARPEGSIAEGYVAEEALTFCSKYLRDVPTKFNRPDRNEDAPSPTRELHVFQSVCTPISKSTTIELDRVLKTKVEWFVLNNSPEVAEYITEFTTTMPGNDAQTTFSDWFKEKINRMKVGTDASRCGAELHSLANGPMFSNTYTACIVNGVRFVVNSRDTRRTTQNSGISTPGCEQGETFYGVLEEILELIYMRDMKVVLFRCKWYKTDKKHCVTKNNITSISTQYEWYKEDQYILATQANQVFYLHDPSKKGQFWKVVQEVNHRKIWDRDIITEVVEDVIHDTNSNDLALSANLDGFTYTSMSIGRPTEVADIPTTSRHNDDDDFIDDKDNDDYLSDTSDEIDDEIDNENVARVYSSDESD